MVGHYLSCQASRTGLYFVFPCQMMEECLELDMTSIPKRGSLETISETVRPTVFVIDDDLSMRRALSNLIESVDLEVRAFASPAEFTKVTLTHAPCCLILDVRLPGLSGLDFQNKLANAGSAIPIIFITAHGDIPMTVRAMKAGAVEFLTKPFRDQDMLDAVYAALGRDRMRYQDENAVLALRAKFQALTRREKEVMACVSRGLMNKQIAAEIGITENTVKVHRGNLVKKMGAKSLAELVRMADRLEAPT